MVNENRPLTDHEHRLVRWMLEHGGAEARDYLSQLAQAEVTPWRCGCGCASLDFQIRGRTAPPPGVQVLASFEFDHGDEIKHIFVFASDGILSGLEVYGFNAVIASRLPSPEELRPHGWERPADG